jgi:Methyltransferase domain
MLEQLQERLKTRARSEILRAKFAAIYYQGLWGKHESRSGAGSVRDSLSVMIAGVALAQVVRDHGIRSISDIPCGDFNWLPDILTTLGEVCYIGFDIVDAVVRRNQKRRPDYEFRVLDITSDAPPGADLIFCKDLTNHLSDPDIRRAIANMRRSGSTFLLASNNCVDENVPLSRSRGASRLVDITAPPFKYPRPFWSMSDYMSLWRLEDLIERGD